MKNPFSRFFRARDKPGVTFQSVGVAPEEAQFLAMLKYQRSEIAGLFRVPPHLIGDLEHATFSSIEHQLFAALASAMADAHRTGHNG